MAYNLNAENDQFSPLLCGSGANYIGIAAPANKDQAEIIGRIIFPRRDQTRDEAYAFWDAEVKTNGVKTLAIVQDSQAEAWLKLKADKTLTVGCEIKGCPKVDMQQLQTFLKWFAKVNQH